jgi:hypothetical protein
MRVKQTALVVSLAFGFLACPTSQAQDTAPATHVTVGFKVWHASWQSYLPAAYTGTTASGAPAIGEDINLVEGGERTNVLPLIAISYGKYFVTASYGRFSSDFFSYSSPYIGTNGGNIVTSRTDHFVRREGDISIGYFVTPEVGLSIGYKDATENRTTSLGIAPQETPFVRTKARGLLLGAIGSFPIQGKLRLYTQVGYGPARIQLRFADPGTASYDTNGRYLIGEIGLSYPILSNYQGISAATATVGYRTQTVKTLTHGSVFHDERWLRDVREGLVLSLNVSI